MSEENNRYEAKRPLILIVDDVPQNLQVLGHKLKESYDISFATNGGQTIELMKHLNPDLILLDVMMPDMDGYEVCQTLKASPRTRDIPVIFLTAKRETEDIVKGFTSGGVDFVSKPFNSTELLARVETHLELKFTREKLKSSLAALEEAHIHILEKNQSISQQNRAITDSLNYARYIQEAMLTPLENFRSFFPDSFIFYKPRDIVSGDFYWFSLRGGLAFLAAADCTGHGVPGAFMSILGNNLLSEIVEKRGIVEPAEILIQLREGVRDALKQESSHNRDGLTISLCVIDVQAGILKFSGSRSSLLYFSEGELIQIKGDRISIGGAHKKNEANFSQHTLPLNRISELYLYSDGYPDQLGGAANTRFMSKNFKSLLSGIHTQPLTQQHTLLENALKEWQGEERAQTDDILVMGFRLPPPVAG